MLAALEAELAGLRAANARLSELADTNEREAFEALDELARRDEEIEALTGGRAAADLVYDHLVHADREEQFRHQLGLRVLLTVPEPDRPLDQLGRLRIGPRWLDDLEELPKVSRLKLVKVLDVVVEVLCGLVWDHPGRDTHQQRTGPGGDDPYVRRDSDGATAWRASLQQRTPQARRLLWWSLPDGGVELARVAAHDDHRMT